MFKWKKTSFGARPFPVKNWKYLFARREANFFFSFLSFAPERENETTTNDGGRKRKSFLSFSSSSAVVVVVVVCAKCCCSHVFLL